MSLRNSFKNWRRDLNDENQDRTANKKKSESMSEPPSKRMRMSVEEDDMDDEEYEEVVSELAAEWRKDKRVRSMATVKNLFDQTSKRRRNWITSEKPLLSDILDKYPCLASSRVVRFLSFLNLVCFHTWIVLGLVHVGT